MFSPSFLPKEGSAEKVKCANLARAFKENFAFEQIAALSYK